MMEIFNFFLSFLCFPTPDADLKLPAVCQLGRGSAVLRNRFVFGWFSDSTPGVKVVLRIFFICLKAQKSPNCR